MKMRKNKKLLSLKKREGMAGWLFILPFCLGFILFSAKPLVETLIMTFNDVKIDFGGYKMQYTGLENLNYIYNVDTDFLLNLFTAVGNMLWQVPCILILSVILAQLVNTEFSGRAFVRTVLFVPVIVMSGTVVLIIQNDVVASATLSGGVVSGGEISYASGMSELLEEAGLGTAIADFFMTVADNMFNLIWKTGVQIVIFLAGLQSISPSLYEAASIEGANRWESFFKITLPCLMPIITINTVYTIVDCFTDSGNEAMNQVLVAVSSIKYGVAAAMSWSYFVLILAFIALVMLILAKLGKKYS